MRKLFTGTENQLHKMFVRDKKMSNLNRPSSAAATSRLKERRKTKRFENARSKGQRWKKRWEKK